jgi:membrane protein DedA with SNARE-associated domain
LQEWIIQIMDRFGYIGIALLIALENIFPPIPSEVILTFGGFMTTYTKLTVWGVIIASTIGSVLGAVVLYWIGRSLTPERLEYWLEGRWGRILRLKKGDVARAKGWFERHGKRAVFFCRCIPLIRSLISIPAGMAKMKMWLFLLLTIAGSLVWNSALIYLGAALGASWEIIISYTNIYAIIALSVLGVILLVFAIIYFKKRSRCNNE